MIRQIYYSVTRFIYKKKFAILGKKCKIHLWGKLICGEYIHVRSDVVIGKNWIMAVYPHYANKDNPVIDGGNKGIWIGDGSSINRNVTIYCADSVEIGNNNLFGSNILITDNDHGTDVSTGVPFIKQPLICKPVVIGNNCWIGEKVCILKGTQIGDNCIIAAGSVVSGIYPSNSIIAGVPAKVIKKWNHDSRCWEREE